jgi:DNA (cytosine-5)-methyltransferase 1
VSEYPVHEPFSHLLDVVDHRAARPISVRGASGFYDRTTRAKLRFDPTFLDDVVEHIEVLSGGRSAIPA